MGEWLRVHTALPEGPDLVSSTHINQLTTAYYFFFKISIFRACTSDPIIQRVEAGGSLEV